MDIEDDRKPFEAETAHDDDAQPDPDEVLAINQRDGKIWLVKIPKHLMARWTAVTEDNVHLATMRVYPSAKRVFLFLPPNRDPNDPNAPIPPPQRANWPVFDTTTAYPSAESGPDVYELTIVQEGVENQLVVAEHAKDPLVSAAASAAAATANTRARLTSLTGRIDRIFNMKPALTPAYRRQMKERNRNHNTPARQTRMLGTADVPGGRGGINRLASGAGAGAGAGAGRPFGDFIQTTPKAAKGTFERMARMPRNQLLDALFAHFRQTPRWSIRALREKTQQPEVYLKEVLSEIAFLNKSGEHTGLWELQDAYKDASMKAENVPSPGMHAGFKVDENDDDEDEEDEDEDDMEEVA